MVKKTNDDALTQEELIREAIGLATTHLMKKGVPVTARTLIQFLMQVEERTEEAVHKSVYQAARKRVQQKMQ
jgi:hypothetical protein